VLTEIERERLAHAVEVTCHERFRRTLERLGAASIGELAEELTRTHMASVRAVTAAPLFNAGRTRASAFRSRSSASSS